jgi:ATP-binding cassette subfamily B protein
MPQLSNGKNIFNLLILTLGSHRRSLVLEHFLALREFFVKHRNKYLLGLACLLLVNLIQLLVPQVLRRFTDTLVAGTGDSGEIAVYSLILTGIALFIAFFRVLWRYFISGSARQLEYWLRNRLFSHLIFLSPKFFHQHKTGNLMALATNDVIAVRMAFGFGLVMLVDAVFITIAATFFMTSIHPVLTLMILLPLPLLVVVVSRFGKIIHQRFKEIQQAIGNLSERVQENISGIRVIQTFAQEETEVGRFTDKAHKTMLANLRLTKVSGAFFPLVHLLASFAFLILLGYGGLMVTRQEISLGDFVALNAYLGMLFWPMMALGWVINLIQRGAASMGRINEIMATPAEITDSPKVYPNFLRGEITIKDLSFAYSPSLPPVLKDISISLPAGGTLAITGHTGSGKTTLLNLLVRIFDPSPGTVFIDGYDIKDLPLGWLREQIGYVPQDVFLFSATLAENIALASGAGREQVEEAARRAQLEQDLKSFPDRLDTLVGERGVTLSGGQKQRVAIARALIKEPVILIMDDSLSAVDRATEEKVLSGLNNTSGRRATTIIVSHRIAAIQHADQIIVLEQGRLIEQGNHSQLLARKGTYHRLYQQQLLEQSLAAQGGGV